MENSAPASCQGGKLAGVGNPSEERPCLGSGRMIGRSEAPRRYRMSGPMTFTTAAVLFLTGLFSYAAWLTSIVFCAANGLRPLLIATAVFFPVGIVHGVGVWLGGW